MIPSYRNGQTHHHGRGRTDFKKFPVKKSMKRQSKTSTRCWNRSHKIDEYTFKTSTDFGGKTFKTLHNYAYCCKSCFEGFITLTY